jgi:seryl-tRNA synthetase
LDFIPKYYKKESCDIKSNNISINDIQKELNNEKIKNQKLEKELNQLKKDLQLEKDKNMALTKANEKFNNEIKSLEFNLKAKDDELEKLKNDLLNLKNKKYKNIDKNIDQNFISIAFTTVEKKFIFPISCKNTERFIDVEAKLYDEYPQYQDGSNYFTVNGHKIQKYKTLLENGIKYSNTIILHEQK